MTAGAWGSGRGREPRPDQLVRALQEIADEVATAGSDRLPPERELAERLGVSRSRLRRALDELTKRGLILRLPGRAGGAYLAHMVESPPIPPILFDSRSRRIERDLGEVKGIPRILADQGVTSRTHVIFEGLQAVPRSVAAMIDIPDEVEAISLLRLRFADDQPLSLERMYLDPGRFPGLLDHSPIVSLYELLAQNYGVVVTRVSETIDVVPAERRVCHLLGIRPGSHVVALRRVAYCAAGWPIEASVDLFRADRMRLTVQARIDHAES